MYVTVSDKFYRGEIKAGLAFFFSSLHNKSQIFKAVRDGVEDCCMVMCVEFEG